MATNSPPNYRPNRMLERTRTTGPPYPTGPHKTRKGIPVISWVPVVRENGRFRACPHPPLRTGTLSDGEYRVRVGKLGVHIDRGSTLLPSMPIYGRAWCTHFPDAPVYESNKK